MEVNDDVVSRRSARLRSAAKVMLRTPYAAQALRALSVRNVYPATPARRTPAIPRPPPSPGTRLRALPPPIQDDQRSNSLAMAQTVALTTLVIFQVFQAGNSRSESESLLRISPVSNPFLFVATLAAVGLHVLALYLPPTQYILRVEPIGINAWARIIVVASTVFLAMEADKLIRRRRQRHAQAYESRHDDDRRPAPNHR
jgi:hypothetical protein